MLQLRENDVMTPGLLACLSETRIGLFDSSEATSTEPLGYVSGSSHRASVDSWREVTSDLVLFTQEDPVGLKGGPNLYSYALNQPQELRDPLGLYGTNDCGYYKQQCTLYKGFYYCTFVYIFCNWFPKPPNPDRPVPNHPDWWASCTRKCLQDCDHDQCVANPPTGEGAWQRFQRVNRCHVRCYIDCALLSIPNPYAPPLFPNPDLN